MTTVNFSSDMVLRVCERRWFLSSVVAHPTAKKERIRRDAHILRLLTTPPAWAGNIIHATLEDKILPAVRAGQNPDVTDALTYAHTLLERQAQFSQQRRYKAISKTKAGRDFCALFADEYGQGLTQDERTDTERRVTTALLNIPKMHSLWPVIHSASEYWIENSFRVRLDGAVLEAKPDLVLRSGRAVTIVDWKSWTSLTADPGEQLHFYAHTLQHYWSRQSLRVGDFTLLGVNLLEGRIIPVHCTEPGLDAVDDRIFEFRERTDALLCGRSWSDVPLRALGAPRGADTCTYCKFVSICRDAVPVAQEGVV